MQVFDRLIESHTVVQKATQRRQMWMRKYEACLHHSLQCSFLLLSTGNVILLEITLLALTVYFLHEITYTKKMPSGNKATYKGNPCMETSATELRKTF